MAVVTGGSSLVVQAACIGGALVIGSSIDNDRKKKENESKQIEANKQITGEIKDAVNNLQNDRSQLASQANTIEQQIAQKQNKLNDPNTSETEKAQIRSEIAALMSSKGGLEQKIKGLDKQIADLIKSNPNSKQEPGLINLPKTQDLDFQTKMIIGAVIFLIMYFMMIKDQDRR
jgi:predicted RNase H-like nuclease (RuvC/YqgF family)